MSCVIRVVYDKCHVWHVLCVKSVMLDTCCVWQLSCVTWIVRDNCHVWYSLCARTVMCDMCPFYMCSVFSSWVKCDMCHVPNYHVWCMWETLCSLSPQAYEMYVSGYQFLVLNNLFMNHWGLQVQSLKLTSTNSFSTPKIISCFLSLFVRCRIVTIIHSQLNE